MGLKIPSKLKIGAHHITISRDAKNLPDGQTVGFYEPNKGQITIAPDIPKSRELVTLIHEVIHALNGELSEEITDAIAQGLASVLLDNKLIKL